ncbi:MAG: hypothetical protein ACO2PM_14820 [Pyrobaculum sp.]
MPKAPSTSETPCNRRCGSFKKEKASRVAASSSRGYLVDDARRLGKGLFKTSAVAVGLTSSPP